MEENIQDDASLRFSVDASLLFELGEQLVARRSIALSELIKNAYDSDATRVEVSFQNVTKPNGQIIITDDGLGMSLEAFKTNWMRVATNNKMDNPRSTIYKRLRTGAKGVGRFAARKLAGQLVIHSIAKLNTAIWEEITVTIDWEKFISGMELSSIGLEFLRTLHHEEKETGVKLTLENVRDTWSLDDIEDVRRDLQDLTVSFVTEKEKTTVKQQDILDDPGFFVFIKAPEFPDQEGNVNDKFFSAANAKLSAEVLSDGTPEYKVRFRGSDREIIFNPKTEKLNKLVSASLVVHYFIYNNQIQEYSGIKLNDARQLGRRFGGVKIYLDNFRIFPYGDPGDDWLGLDETRAGRLSTVDGILKNLLPKNVDRPMLNIPGNNQLFGGVLISREIHPELNPNISRERLLENESYFQLRRFARLGIDWLTLEWARHESEEKERERNKEREIEIERNNEKNKEKINNEINNNEINNNEINNNEINNNEINNNEINNNEINNNEINNKESKFNEDAPNNSFLNNDSESTQSEIQEKNTNDIKGNKSSANISIENTLSNFKAKIEKITSSVQEPEIKNSLIAEFEKLQQTVEEKEAEQIDKISTLRILASAGSSVVIFNHQIRAVIDGLRRLVYDLGEEGESPDIIFLSNLDENRRRLKIWLKMLEGQAIQLGLLLGTEARRRRKKLVCRPIVDQLINTFATYSETNGILIKNEVNPMLKTPPMYEAELHSLLLNVITNALKAVKEQRERTIEIYGKSDKGAFVLMIKDTGKGISDSDKQSVFEPFFTTSTPDPVLGVGTGLGLTIVKDIVTEHSGTVKFIDIELPWRTCMEIKLPQGVDE